jgi:2-dehydro-3-deoxy-D-gluconate 5-dehydrogenase
MTKEIFSKTAFQNKCAIIAGGGGDIALEIAKNFVISGMKKIALLDLDRGQLQLAAKKLQKFDCQVFEICVDLSNETETTKAIEDLFNKESPWNILITAAGFFIGSLLLEAKISDFERLVKINASAVLHISKLVAEQMIRNGGGKITHIGSSSTYFGTPGSGIYAASKAIVNQLTQTMAVEWGPYNIQVNTICPTVTETKFLELVKGDDRHAKLREKLASKMPQKRLLKPIDIAPLAIFLSSDAAEMINGAIIPIDGGSRLVST